jgi:hypothetical protein
MTDKMFIGLMNGAVIGAWCGLFIWLKAMLARKGKRGFAWGFLAFVISGPASVLSVVLVVILLARLF